MASARNTNCNSKLHNSRASTRQLSDRSEVSVTRAAQRPREQCHVTGVAVPLCGARAPVRMESKSRVIGREKMAKSVRDKSTQVSLLHNSLLERNAALEKEILHLKGELKEKVLCMSSLSTLIQEKDEHLKELTSERELHCQTKAQLQKAEMAVQEQMQINHERTSACEQTIKELKLLHNVNIAELKKEMDSERHSNNEKISKLKQQVSDILEGRSWERHQQLEDLTKEIVRLTEETKTLKKQLTAEQIPKMCKNCKSLQSRLEEKTLQLRLKEKTVEELHNFCKRFEKQLTQQDKLLGLSVKTD
nr:PREDICTED: serine/threonine-protein kinase MRCK beta-like isoform X1 [Lepisosteus oculatus]XP_015218345.1 PREDICTED: serine/threonine-protein kinase MRCK beta-like isoform X1 [Lepisosteus oculatus]